MAPQYFSGLLILCTCFLLEVSSRPSSNELTTPTNIEEDTEGNEAKLLNEKEKYLTLLDNTKEILDKINIVNAALKKPNRRQQIKYNTESPNPGGYVLNRDILEKLQQIIASGKLQPLLETNNYQESNSLNDFHRNIQRYSKSLPYNPQIMAGNQITPSVIPLPYVQNIPVLVMPTLNAYNPGSGHDYNNVDGISHYQNRQGLPSLPFQWPLAPYFPILIKDPFLTFLQGGGWSNIFEAGQNADVCSRKQKSSEQINELTFQDASDNETESDDNITKKLTISSREGRALKKRNVSKSTSTDDSKTQQKSEKFLLKPNTTQKPARPQPVSSIEPTKDVKNTNEDDGDLRFGAFTFFGEKKPVAPSPGFFINRLKVRKGGVAIAGPGGVATAGRGGTAIVGPGGLAYTQPGGLAVAGPAARVVALSPDSNLSSIISQLHHLSAKDGSVPRFLKEIPEGKVVATGPVIYYNSKLFRGEQRRGFQGDNGEYKREEYNWRPDIYHYNRGRFVKERHLTIHPKFMLFVKPRAFALTSSGVAIANPVSNVVISQNETASIEHAPMATAVAGPGGIAHAQSVQYLPFYGGGKGMYLEIKKDTSGRVISELVVSEDKISMDSVIKNSDENLLAKVLAANLQSLKVLSSSTLKLHNLGRRTGSLDNADKERFKSQLEKLGETASNTIKLIEEVSDNIDGLFKSNPKVRQYQEDETDEINEEGIGIDAPNGDDSFSDALLGGATVAEAKPVGLAVIGENGLAASRPIGTAVAVSGIAIARPVATAVAGVNPAALGLNLSINHSKN
ncbi:uncharacterized protein LOC106139763 [Amyelois transitella]|uniref:uncharacterized protein LOC106139763 n=1 Tax=Amyelois transitella TaxID=680683 RepID=UPI00298F899C|nr:uncharacterized protein LOC106139763 [Amyelois transitella]